jgi:hypothetical protein
MNITELVEKGYVAAERCKVNSQYAGEYISGLEYEEWLTLAIRFVELNFPGDTDTKRFRGVAEKANGNGPESFNTMIGILKAFQEYPPVPAKVDIMPLIEDVCINFNRFDINIRRRYGNRETIKINDEHDLQDALHAILKLFINDIRPEDYVPSYAGGNSRVDFLLPEYNLVIETKMTNSSLHDKQVGEQLIIDIERYKHTNNINHLVCFVYDKDANITNPNGLINDLENLSDERMRVTLFIAPQ